MISLNVIAISSDRQRDKCFSFSLFSLSHTLLNWLIKMRLLDLLTFSVS